MEVQIQWVHFVAATRGGKGEGRDFLRRLLEVPCPGEACLPQNGLGLSWWAVGGLVCIPWETDSWRGSCRNSEVTALPGALQVDQQPRKVPGMEQHAPSFTYDMHPWILRAQDLKPGCLSSHLLLPLLWESLNPSEPQFPHL